MRVEKESQESGEDSEPVKLRQKSAPSPGRRPTSIADRLSLLQSSTEIWKEKVEDKDMAQFTVEGKMNRLGGDSRNLIHSDVLLILLCFI